MNNSPNQTSQKFPLPITERITNELNSFFVFDETERVIIDVMLDEVLHLEIESLSKAHKEWATDERERIVATLNEMILENAHKLDNSSGQNTVNHFRRWTLEDVIERIQWSR